MKRTILFIAIGLLLTMAADAGLVKATSPYGDASTLTPTDCIGTLCTAPSGVTMTELDFSFSFASGEIFYFTVTSNTSDYSLVLQGDTNFIADDPSTPFFGFGTLDCPVDPNTPLCTGVDATTDPLSTMTPGSSDGNHNQVTFDIHGNGQNFVFFAVLPAASGNATRVVTDLAGVTATLTLNGTTVPEPRFVTIVVLGFVGLVLLLRRLRPRLT